MKAARIPAAQEGGGAPVVPDFTPVTAEQFRGHLRSCPGCQGPSGTWCPVGMDLLERIALQSRRESERGDRAQAWELIRAGWRFFPRSEDSELMSWYWRAPPRREGSAGRLYRSTNQAWRAMKRMQGLDPDDTGGMRR